MSSLPVLGPLLRTGTSRGSAYRAFTLGSGAKLLLPEGMLCPALALYNPQAVTGLIAKAAIHARIWRGVPVRLDRDAEASLEQCLASALGVREVRCAFQVAADTPTAKLVASVMDGRARTLAYAKIAVRDGAKAAVSYEASLLGSLAAYPELEAHVPRLLSLLDWRGCHVALVSPGPAQRAPRRFGPRHAAFLDALRRATAKRCRLGETAVAKDLDSFVAQGLASMPPEWRDRYLRAHEIFRYRAGEEVAVTLAHGDFAPWNTRVGRSGSLFVFDWEFAVPRMTPGYDMLHFHLGWWAAGGRRVTPRRLAELFAVARRLGVDMGDPELSALTAFVRIGLKAQRENVSGRMLPLAGNGIDVLKRLVT